MRKMTQPSTVSLLPSKLSSSAADTFQFPPRIRKFLNKVSRIIDKHAKDHKTYLFSVRERRILDSLQKINDTNNYCPHSPVKLNYNYHSSEGKEEKEKEEKEEPSHNYHHQLRRCKKIMLKQGYWDDFLDMMYSLNVSPMDSLVGMLRIKLVLIVAARSLETQSSSSSCDNDRENSAVEEKLLSSLLTSADKEICKAYHDIHQKDMQQNDERETETGFDILKRIMKNMFIWDYYCERKWAHQVMFLQRSLKHEEQPSSERCHNLTISEAETKDLLEIAITLQCAISLDDPGNSSKSSHNNVSSSDSSFDSEKQHGHSANVARLVEAEKSLHQNNNNNSPDVSKSLILWRFEKHMSSRFPSVSEQYKAISEIYGLHE